MARTYFIFLIVAGVLASMVSNGSRLNSGADYDAFNAAGRSSQDQSSEADDWNASGAPGDGVELKREADGHFYANVEINNIPIRILVDTGASGIALSRADARRAGLAVASGMFEVVGEGADGDVRGEYVTLDKVSLGTKTAQSVPAVVLNSGEMSLLGQSFLKEFASVEIHGDTMKLK